jgi:hypothetical protein
MRTDIRRIHRLVVARFVDALPHISVDNPSKLVPLYATMGEIAAFASNTTSLALVLSRRRRLRLFRTSGRNQYQSNCVGYNDARLHDGSSS